MVGSPCVAPAAYLSCGPGTAVAEADHSPRRYDNTRRARQAGATRDRIVEAAWTILRRSSVADWSGVTIRAVAQQAEVSERTVYRHFQTERGLRDAVMARLEAQAGIDLDTMRLDDVAAVAARIIDQVAAFAPPSHRPLDATLSDADRRQRLALVRAVAERAPGWSDTEVAHAAAVLDVLWNAASLNRLSRSWSMDRDAVAATVSWAIDLVAAAVEGDRPPLG